MHVNTRVVLPFYIRGLILTGLSYSKISTLSHSVTQSTHLTFSALSFLATEFVIVPCVPTNIQSSSYSIQLLSLHTIYLVKVGVTQFSKRNSILCPDWCL